MEKFYTCRYDRPFKEIFLNGNNKNLLKGLIETILDIKIENIEIKPNERNSSNLKIKRKYFDALIYTRNKKIGIEVNSHAKEEYVKPRNASYVFDIYSHHTLVGKSYNENIDIIQINLSYNLNDQEKSRIYKLRDEKGKEYIKNLYVYEINMDYYRLLWYTNKNEEIKKNKYLVMLDLEEKELKKMSMQDKEVGEYMEKITKLNEEPEFREYMSLEEDERKIFNSRMEAATKKGIEQGIEHGKIEGFMETARKMLSKGIEIDDIIELTSLSREQIETLK